MGLETMMLCGKLNLPVVQRLVSAESALSSDSPIGLRSNATGAIESWLEVN